MDDKISDVYMERREGPCIHRVLSWALVGSQGDRGGFTGKRKLFGLFRFYGPKITALFDAMTLIYISENRSLFSS